MSQARMQFRPASAAQSHRGTIDREAPREPKRLFAFADRPLQGNISKEAQTTCEPRPDLHRQGRRFFHFRPAPADNEPGKADRASGMLAPDVFSERIIDAG